jgi:RNA polymerase sigma factor (sigma-70 family)
VTDSADDCDGEIDDLYRKTSGRVLGYLINMGTDRGLAEEITDDAFLVARRNWLRIRSSDCPESYIFTVARHERIRRQPRISRASRDLRPDQPERLKDQVTDPSEHVIDRVVLRAALLELPDRLREAVTLRYVEDLSVETTAQIMRVSTGAVKRYAFDGLYRLRSLIPDFRTVRGEEDR